MSMALPRAIPHLASFPIAGCMRNDAFVKLLSAHAISQVGSQVTLIALPLTAIGLHASASEMGVLRAMEYVPLLLIGLLAGVWVDRMPRRPLLIGSDLGRAVLMAALPLAAILGILRLEFIYLIALLAGALTVLFDVALQSYVPGIVHRADLVEANSKLEVTQSIGFTAGPGIGGMLVELIGAPFAIILDALSFLSSALLISRIKTPDPRPQPRERGRTLRGDIVEGLAVIVKQPMLRALAGCSATMNLSYQALLTVLLVYVARDLGLPATSLGIVITANGVGGIVGASLASRASRRFGTGTTIVGAAVLPALGALVAVLAGPSDQVTAIGLLAFSQFVLGVAPAIYNITSVSLRQAISPDHLRGRISASTRVLMWSTLPMGALLGGALGEILGMRAALAIASIGFLLGSGWVIFSPVARRSHLPLVDPT